MLYETLAAAVPLILGAGAWYLKAKFSNHSKAIAAIESGVLHAWREYGKSRKDELKAEVADPDHERSSSKFELPDIDTLTQLATSKAIEVMASASKGKDLGSIINPNLWGDEIEKAIERIKKG